MSNAQLAEPNWTLYTVRHLRTFKRRRQTCDIILNPERTNITLLYTSPSGSGRHYSTFARNIPPSNQPNKSSREPKISHTFPSPLHQGKGALSSLPHPQNPPSLPPLGYSRRLRTATFSPDGKNHKTRTLPPQNNLLPHTHHSPALSSFHLPATRNHPTTNHLTQPETERHTRYQPL